MLIWKNKGTKITESAFYGEQSLAVLEMFLDPYFHLIYCFMETLDECFHLKLIDSVSMALLTCCFKSWKT